MRYLKRFEDIEWDKEDEERAKKNALSEFAHLQKAEAEKKEKRYQRSYKEDPDGMYPRDDKKYDKPRQDDPEYRDWYLANHSEGLFSRWSDEEKEDDGPLFGRHWKEDKEDDGPLFGRNLKDGSDVVKSNKIDNYPMSVRTIYNRFTLEQKNFLNSNLDEFAKYAKRL